MKALLIAAALLAAPLSLSPAAAQEQPAKPAAGQGNAGANAMQDRSFRSPAEQLFVQKCAMCHRQFGMGTVILQRRTGPEKAWLEHRDDLTEDFITAVARNGLSNMPRIPRGEVSDAQMAQIAKYLANGPARKDVKK